MGKNKKVDVDPIGTEEKLVALFDVVVDQLALKLQSGEYTAADISNAIKLLQNNGISVGKLSGSNVERLEQVLPDLDEMDLRLN